MKTSEQQPSP